MGVLKLSRSRGPDLVIRIAGTKLARSMPYLDILHGRVIACVAPHSISRGGMCVRRYGEQCTIPRVSNGKRCDGN